MDDLFRILDRPPLSLILASQSPSRRRLLLNAGIRPTISLSHVDEGEALARAAASAGIGLADMPAAMRVEILSQAKARAVARTYSDIAQALREAEDGADGLMEFYRPQFGGSGSASSAVSKTSGISGTSETPAISAVSQPKAQSLHDFLQADPGYAGLHRLYGAGPLVLGADSLFALNGHVFGKPHSPEVARERLRLMRGQTGVLWTGHCLIDPFSGREERAVSQARVHFADYTDADIEAYIASGEPLEVAGCFTLEGLGSAFIDSVSGDPSGVMGLSLPLLRKMLGRFDLPWPALWNMAKSRGRLELATDSLSDSNSDSASSSAAATSQAPAFRDYLSGKDRRAAVNVPDGNINQPGDGWIDCPCGHRHWGLNGAAGLLLVRRDPATGSPTHVVLQHRAAWSAEGGTWGVPGGALSDGENPLEGALRESGEEAGISAGDLAIRAAYREDHGPWAYTTVIAFEKPGRQVHPYASDDESTEVAWIPLERIPDLRLLSAFAQDWPHFLATINRLAPAES